MLPLLSLKTCGEQRTDGFLFRGERESSPEEDVIRKMRDAVASRKKREELEGFQRLVADKLHADDLQRAKELCGTAKLLDLF
jgi:hypothetical protein